MWEDRQGGEVGDLETGAGLGCLGQGPGLRRLGLLWAATCLETCLLAEGAGLGCEDPLRVDLAPEVQARRTLDPWGQGPRGDRRQTHGEDSTPETGGVQGAHLLRAWRLRQLLGRVEGTQGQEAHAHAWGLLALPSSRGRCRWPGVP